MTVARDRSESTGAEEVIEARLMQWLPPVATQSASTRRVPTPKADRRHVRVEELSRGDDVTGTAWGRIGTLASLRAGRWFEGAVGLLSSVVRLSEVVRVTTAKVRAGFDWRVVAVF